MSGHLNYKQQPNQNCKVSFHSALVLLFIPGNQVEMLITQGTNCVLGEWVMWPLNRTYGFLMILSCDPPQI